MQIAVREIMSAKRTVPPYWAFYVEAVDLNCTVSMASTGTPPAVTLEYSTNNGNTWQTFNTDGTTTVTLAKYGDRVHFRAGANGNTRFASIQTSYRSFVFTGGVIVGGNIMSLLSQTEGAITTLPATYTFCSLFYGQEALLDASRLSLPATTLKDSCYRSLFDRCAYLRCGPLRLPATNLASNCYRSMFYFCSALTTPPTLPATKLASSCYYYMFYDCHELATAPELPASTMVLDCYRYMFSGCTKVAAITTRQESFTGCDSWVTGVATYGEFTCSATLGTPVDILRGDSACPPLWSVKNLAYIYVEAKTANSTVAMEAVGTPPSVSLEYTADGGATWLPFSASGGTTVTLTTVGQKIYLRATTDGNASLASSAADYHRFVFTGAVSVGGNAIGLLTQDMTDFSLETPYAMAYLFYGQTALVDASDFRLLATTISASCYRGMFYGCSAVAAVPALPALTLAEGCYQDMFHGCASISTAPVLLAPTMTTDCYNSMFYGCSLIDEITTSQTSFEGCTNWVNGVSVSGTFTCPAELGTESTIERGVSACPENWEVGLPTYFYVEAKSANSTVKMMAQGSAPSVTLECSVDDMDTWSDFDTSGGQTITLANVGDRVYFRAGVGGNTSFAASANDYRYFALTGGVAVGGNIHTLLVWNGRMTALTGSFTFCSLFYGQSALLTAEDLLLPATTLVDSCYRSLFDRCTSLTTGPVLPATTIVANCYRSMFYSCSALTAAPELPGERLVTDCYKYMFFGCNSIPSITTRQKTFTGCTNWVQNITSTGTFYCPTALGTQAKITRGQNGCPKNWTVINI